MIFKIHDSQKIIFIENFKTKFKKNVRTKMKKKLLETTLK